VEDGVDIVEDVLRAECRGQVAMAVRDEFQAEAGGEGGHEIGIEVRDAAIWILAEDSVCVLRELPLVNLFINRIIEI